MSHPLTHTLTEAEEYLVALPTIPLASSYPSAPTLSGHLDALMPPTLHHTSVPASTSFPRRTAPLRDPIPTNSPLGGPPSRPSFTNGPASVPPVLESGEQPSGSQWEVLHIPAAVSAHLSWPGTLGPAGAKARWEQLERMLFIATGVCCICERPGRAVNRRWCWKDQAGHMRSGGTRECLCRAHRKEARREGSVITWLKVKLTHEGIGKCGKFCPGGEYAWVAGAKALR